MTPTPWLTTWEPLLLLWEAVWSTGPLSRFRAPAEELPCLSPGLPHSSRHLLPGLVRSPFSAPDAGVCVLPSGVPARGVCKLSARGSQPGLHVGLPASRSGPTSLWDAVRSGRLGERVTDASTTVVPVRITDGGMVWGGTATRATRPKGQASVGTPGGFGEHSLKEDTGRPGQA